jgi:signal peptidase I
VGGEQKKKSVVREYAEAIIIAIALALFIRTFVVQAFKIPSGSMLPTLQIGDHLLVNKFIYGIRMPFTGMSLIPIKDPKHGDVIVFRYPRDRSIDYIKRVVGVPGDRIQVKNKQLYLNDKKAEDRYAHFTTSHIQPHNVSPKDNFGPITVPEGKYFVMGDNRDNSSDSRFWGYVDDSDVRGKAMIIYWSWDIDKTLFSMERFSSIRWSRLADIIH